MEQNTNSGMICVVCTDEGGRKVTLLVDPQSLTEDLQVLIEVELNIVVAEQQVIAADGRILRSDATLAAQGIDKDTSVTVRRVHQNEKTNLGSHTQTKVQPEAQIQPNPRRHQPVTLEEASARIKQIFSDGAGQMSKPLLVESDPEVQRFLYDKIHWENVNENLSTAQELTPETFFGVHMLFVNCEINKVKIKALIDCGAQVSLINANTAERCGLMRLLDSRVSVLMRGVGVRRTLGRIHMAVVNLGGLHIPFSLYVIDDDKMDFIIGLDQMRRHRMLIDLRDNCLRIEDSMIPFLSDSEVPQLITGQEVEDSATKAPGTNASGAENQRQPMSDAIAQMVRTEEEKRAPGGEELLLQPGTDGLDANKEQSVVSLMSLTGCSRAGAIKLLEATGWNVNLAVSLFLDDR